MRLFTGLVQMRLDKPGVVNFSNEVWTGWADSREAALGECIEKTMEKHPGGSVSWQGCYDITDVAKQLMEFRHD